MRTPFKRSKSDSECAPQPEQTRTEEIGSAAAETTAEGSAASGKRPAYQATEEELTKAFSDEQSPLSSISFGDKINANPEYLQRMRQLVFKYRHLWRTPSFTAGETKVPDELHCRIVTDNPFTGRPRMHSTNATMREVIRKEVDTQRKAGIIEPSASPFASSILVLRERQRRGARGPGGERRQETGGTLRCGGGAYL